jgi:hypothetical protein
MNVRIMEAGPNRTFRGLEHLRDFRVGHALDIEHGNHDSVSVGQLPKRSVQFYLKLVEIGLPLGIGLMGGVNERGILLRR